MRLPGLSDSEKRVRNDFLNGARTTFTARDPALDDIAHGASWGPDRTIRADFLKKLIEEVGERRAPLRVVGARIVGPVELEYLELGYSLSFSSCYFDEEIDLHDTRLRRLNLRGTRLAGLMGAQMHVDGSVVLHESRIDGRLRLDSAVIGGGLLVTDAMVCNPGGMALRVDRARITGDLSLWGTTIEGSTLLRDTRTDGVLSLESARLISTGEFAMDAARVQVGSDLVGDGLYAEGQIRFSGAQIAGLFRLADAKLNNPGDIALEAYQIRVGADLQLYRGFEATGQVRIPGAHVAGHVRFDEAVLRGNGEDALDARYVEVGGAIRCRKMHSTGALRFASARVGSDLDFSEALLTTGTRGADRNILFLGHLRSAELTLRFAAPPEGGIHLANAQVGVLNDDPATWPPRLAHDGFAYERIAEPGSLTGRIEWLKREIGGYRPGPYEQLASVYRRQGLEGEARRVLLAKQRARRKTLSLAARPWGFVQDAAVGYGYRPERALGWLVALLITGTIVFGLHHPIPSGPDKAAPFNPLIYSLDLLLPVINFGQGRAYVATGGYQWVAYLLTAAGWILATTIAAGVARAVNRA
ncbi:oxidoreductase [Catenulispora yoronensis]|uniref:Oxidoreductase n=1 Tax=Catenulispora yoronensis TaxID=450799 RepID=A0ABP5FWB7_9ACTN